MKNLVLIILSHLLCLQAFAWSESNGGTGDGAKAANEANRVADQLTLDMWKVPALQLYYKARAYEIVPKKYLILNGAKVDAYTTIDTNYDRVVIYIDEDNWFRLDKESQRALMLHELTHFMFFTDTDYMFSQVAVSKMDKYAKLQKKYPFSESPIDSELISTLQQCNLSQFVAAYLLVLKLDYLVSEKALTLLQLIDRSNCDNIKHYPPLIDLMASYR